MGGFEKPSTDDELRIARKLTFPHSWYVSSLPLSAALDTSFTGEPGAVVTAALLTARLRERSAPLVLRQGVQWQATCGRRRRDGRH